jgi:hypothetical protein
MACSASFFSSGVSKTKASVVMNIAAIDAALANADRSYFNWINYTLFYKIGISLQRKH